MYLLEPGLILVLFLLDIALPPHPGDEGRPVEQFTFHKTEVSYNVSLPICAELQIVARAVVAEF